MGPRKLIALTVATLVTTVITAAVPSIVSAHASIQLYGEKATPGGRGVLFVRIPHGCSGAATDTIEVSIPAGFTAVRPAMVSGWTASTVTTGSVVTSVKWTGGPLPDSQFADFGIAVKYPTTAGKYGLKVVQNCGTANVTWDGAKIPMLTVAAIPPSYAGDLVVENHADKHLAVEADLSSVHHGKMATLRVTLDGKVVKRFGVRLDNRGDFSGVFALSGKTSDGTRYKIPSGAVIDLLVDKTLMSSATLGPTTLAKTKTKTTDHGH